MLSSGRPIFCDLIDLKFHHKNGVNGNELTR
uniref:Uncharacterized protein n=1 Tax=Anguilla anguilla TaxID=7936 RepID=A0A0E9PZA6_ANGAN